MASPNFKDIVANVKLAIADVRSMPKARKKKETRKPTALINFNNIAVFDRRFKNDIEVCTCVVSKMVFSKKINIDGSIDTSNMPTLRKYELWSYIYFLFYYNHTSIDEFASMKSKRMGTASAEAFYKTVRDAVDNSYVNETTRVLTVQRDIQDVAVSMDIQTLAYFINSMVHKYESNLTNPIVDFLKDMFMQRQQTAFNNLSIKTGTTEVSNVKIDYSINNGRTER
jgi:hypothetical protein